MPLSPVRKVTGLAALSVLTLLGACNTESPLGSADSGTVRTSELRTLNTPAVSTGEGRVAGNPNATNRLSPADATLRACTADTPRPNGAAASVQKKLLSASGKVISFQLFEPKTPKRILKAYADNFAANRKQPWTH